MRLKPFVMNGLHGLSRRIGQWANGLGSSCNRQNLIEISPGNRQKKGLAESWLTAYTQYSESVGLLPGATRACRVRETGFRTHTELDGVADITPFANMSCNNATN